MDPFCRSFRCLVSTRTSYFHENRARHSFTRQAGSLFKLVAPLESMGVGRRISCQRREFIWGALTEIESTYIHIRMNFYSLSSTGAKSYPISSDDFVRKIRLFSSRYFPYPRIVTHNVLIRGWLIIIVSPLHKRTAHMIGCNGQEAKSIVKYRSSSLTSSNEVDSDRLRGVYSCTVRQSRMHNAYAQAAAHALSIDR